MKLKSIAIFLFVVIGIIFLLVLKYGIWETADEGKTEYISIQAGGESCMECHNQYEGYSQYHNPKSIGCAVCHLGQPQAKDKEKAHIGLVRIPGNLSDAAKTCGTCHPSELEKVEKSLMTNNSGLVAVDKFVFGEVHSPDGIHDIRQLGHSAADEHLRDLCANCHLGAEKTEYGEITELSRGGGCNACHLNYSDKATEGLQNYLSSNKNKLPDFHPSTDVFIKDIHCFGCHSRSSRISTNYMGWQETLLEENEFIANKDYKTFEDKRVYKRQSEDVHHKGGMLCIDCHSSHEVMGDGKTYAHEEDAVHLSCSDCHFKELPTTVVFDSLDRESLLVYNHRAYSHDTLRMLKVSEDGHPLVNTYLLEGQAFLIGKGDQKIRKISKQADQCSRDNAHENLSCSSCHSAWAPRCIGCHNTYEKENPSGYDLLEKKYKEGSWVEHVFEFSADQPSLGVRENGEDIEIEPAIPGMIMTLDHDSFKGDSIDGTTFHRLYAPNSPHTTTSQIRDCASCHMNPATLGYGQGTFDIQFEGDRASLAFNPSYALSPQDGLPEDAWIPFMKKPMATVFSTRSNFRPFNVEEQKAILTVGVCLQCHQQDSELMKSSLEGGIKPLLLNRSKQCIIPTFDP